MNLKSIANIYFDEHANLICPRAEHTVISTFILEPEEEFESCEAEHCECIQSSLLKSSKNLLVTLVTEKNDIEEFLIFRFHKDSRRKTIKLFFKR